MPWPHRFCTGVDGKTYDLGTNDGRVGLIRLSRRLLPGDVFEEELRRVRLEDRHPVVQVEPEGFIFLPRVEAIPLLVSDGNDELFRLLRQEKHPAGFVFFLLIWDKQFSITTGLFTRNVAATG